MDYEPQAQEQLRQPKGVCKRLEDVTSFSDLAEVVFLMDSRSVHTGWNPGEPGDVSEGRYDNKAAWLTTTNRYHLDEWWIYPDDSEGYNLGKIARQINPDWKEGDSWAGDLSVEEQTQILKKSWERAQDERAAQLAKELGGKAVKLKHVSMEAGISSAVILSESVANEQIVFRGVSNQRRESVSTQVSGMLRTGTTDTSEPANGPIYLNRVSQVIEDSEVRDAVYTLADNPTEEQFRNLIELYTQKGLPLIAEEATTSLGKVLDKVERSGISFKEALVDIHTQLMQGNVGTSPFIATGVTAKECEGFTGTNGLVLVASLKEDRVSDLKARGDERLIKGWISGNEVKAIIPINRQTLGSGSSATEDIEKVFQESGEEVKSLLVDRN
jgi:hypothetical protein